MKNKVVKEAVNLLGVSLIFPVIGAGAVVTKDDLDHTLMAGNPARQIGWMFICGEKLLGA